MCYLYTFKVQYFDFIQTELNRYDTNITPDIVLSVIKIESSFDADAVSRVGACGLMQIMPSTAVLIQREMKKTGRDIDITNLFDTKVNISLGVWYLVYLEKKMQNLDFVIAGYNAGEVKALEWQNANIHPDNIPYKETREYVKKFNYAHNIYSYKMAIRKVLTV